MQRWRFAVVLFLCACACITVAIVNRDVYPAQIGGIPADAVDSGAGWTAYAPLDVSSPSPSRFDSFELWDPYLWAGAGMALSLVAFCVLAYSLRHPRA